MKFFPALFLFILFSCKSTETPATQTFTRKLLKVNDSTYLSYRPKPLIFAVESNSPIFIGEDGILVVDAGGIPESGQQIIDQIKSISDKPVKYLINTHGHGDHTMGNQVFKKEFPDIQIISHQYTVDYLTAETGGINYIHQYPQSTIDYLNDEVKRVTNEARPGFKDVVQNLEQHINVDAIYRFNKWKDVIITPATTIVNDSLTINLGNRKIQILFLGKGDTAGDLWVYLPEEQILCSGDALVNPIPYGYSRHPSEWLETLKLAEKLNFKTIIPGHGDILNGKTYLRQMITLLEYNKAHVSNGIAQNLPVEAIRKSLDTSDFEQKFAVGNEVWRYYFYEYFINPNINRFYQQLSAKDSK